MLPRPVVIGIIVLVSLAWAANTVVTLAFGGGDPMINGIFTAIIGGVLALDRRGGPPRGRLSTRKGRNGDSEDGGET